MDLYYSARWQARRKAERRLLLAVECPPPALYRRILVPYYTKAPSWLFVAAPGGKIWAMWPSPPPHADAHSGGKKYISCMDYDDGNTTSTTTTICTYLNLSPLYRSARLAHRNSDGGPQLWVYTGCLPTLHPRVDDPMLSEHSELLSDSLDAFRAYRVFIEQGGILAWRLTKRGPPFLARYPMSEYWSRIWVLVTK